MGLNNHEFQHTEETLRNGLKFLYLDRPQAHSMALIGRVRGGPVCESADNLGVSHLLEHLHMSVSSRHPTRLEMLRALDDLPGSVDAETDATGLLFSFDVAPECTIEALELLVEILQHRTFPREVIDSEMALLVTELETMDGYRSAPLQRLFKGHPYGQPFGGTVRTLRNLTEEQIEAFDRRMFLPSATSVCAVGPLGDGRLDRLRERLSAIPSTTYEPLEFPEPPEFLLPRFETIAHRGRMCNSTIVFRTSVLDSPEAYSAVMIARMGLTRFSSPLYEKLRYSRGIAYLFSTEWTGLPGVNLFWIYGTTSGRNRDQFFEEVFRELRRTIESPSPPAWFEPARLDYLYAIRRALDFPASIANRLVRESHRFGGDISPSIPEEIQVTQELTWQEAQRTYASIFRRENLFAFAQGINRFLDDRRFRKFVSTLMP
ncbi:MAG: hypothetical protein DCC65_07070 [Planctomycetota bacterium]|nr:MAG: hypothetical protein DCC65_07070 [Planctomycetota bacterium]